MSAPAQGRLGAQVKTAPAGNRGLATTNPSKEHFVTTTPQSTPRTCEIDGCTKPRRRKLRICGMHESRRRRGQDMTAPPQRIIGDNVARFWAKVNGGDVDTCWLWTGATNNHGYPQIRIGEITVLAHRYAYENTRAEIPTGLELDHLCKTPLCVNPWHLEPVTRQVNVDRADYSRNGGDQRSEAARAARRKSKAVV